MWCFFTQLFTLAVMRWPCPYRTSHSTCTLDLIITVLMLLLPERTNLISCCIIKLNNELPIYLKYCRRVRTTMKRVAKLKSPYARVEYVGKYSSSNRRVLLCLYAFAGQSKVWTGKWASYCFTTQLECHTRVLFFNRIFN